MKFMLDNIAKALWLSVTTNPKRLAEARRRADSEWSEYFKKVASNLGDLSSFGSDEIKRLERGRDSVQLLKAYLSDGVISSNGVGAAALLFSLLVKDGRSYLARVLEQGDSQLRIPILKYIGSDLPCYETEIEEGNNYRSFILEDSQFVICLLQQLEDKDPEVVKAAVQTCGILSIPGTNALLMNLLRRTDLLERERILYWLSSSEEPLTADVLRCALDVSQKKDKYYNYVWVFKRFAQHEDAELRRLACNELERARQWLSDTFDKKKVCDNSRYNTCALLVALVQLEGEVGRNRLLSLFRDNKQRTIAIEASGKVFAGSGDGEIVQVLERISHDVDERELKEIYYALQLIGGEMAEQLLRELDVGPTMNEMKTCIVASGLSDKKTIEEGIERLQSRSSTDEPPYPPDFYEVLSEIGIVVGFDSTTRDMPCRHDALVADFARHSYGIFMPEAISEELHMRHSKDCDWHYTLRFSHGNKLYEGSLRNFGRKGGYDSVRTVAMMNQALADSDRKERFIAIDYDYYVFADPDIFVPLANELRFPIDAELNKKISEEAGGVMHSTEDDVRVLLDELNHSDILVRSVAAKALGHVRKNENVMVALIIALYNSDNHEIRGDVVAGITSGQYGYYAAGRRVSSDAIAQYDGVRTGLIQALDNSDARIRLAALTGLSCVSNQADIRKAATRALADPDIGVRKAAEKLLSDVKK